MTGVTVRAKTPEPAVLGRNIEPMSTVRIVTYPDPINGTGFCAAVWRTSDGSTWDRGGVAHANAASRAEQDARRWLLNATEDDRAIVLLVGNPLVVANSRALGRLLDMSLEPAAAGRIAA